MRDAPRRNSALDILRAVAVLLVFSRHAEIPPLVTHVGWAGVDLFFVLSGFLVSGLLFREYQLAQRVSPGRFLLRRGFKIYPQFYLLLAVTILIGFVSGTRAPAPKIAAEAAFVQNYFDGLWGHTWSLAVEEHFYLLLAAATAMLAKRGGENPFGVLPKAISVIFVLSLCARIIAWRHDPHWSYRAHLFPSHLRMDSLLAGVLLGYYHVFRGAELGRFVKRFREWLGPVSLLMLSPIMVLEQSDPFVYTVGFSMLWIGFGLLLLLTLYPLRPAGRVGLVGRGLVRLGQVSYAFYLWHIPILSGGEQLLTSAAKRGVPVSIGLIWMELVCAFIATTLAAFLSTWLVEAPFLRWRDYWVPSMVKPTLEATDLSSGPAPAVRLSFPLAEHPTESS